MTIKKSIDENGRLLISDPAKYFLEDEIKHLREHVKVLQEENDLLNKQLEYLDSVLPCDLDEMLENMEEEE